MMIARSNNGTSTEATFTAAAAGVMISTTDTATDTHHAMMSLTIIMSCLQSNMTNFCLVRLLLFLVLWSIASPPQEIVGVVRTNMAWH